MSHTLTRRIAQVALLAGAAAAPLLGASAASAAELPTQAGLGGLTNLDGAHLGDTAGSASQRVGGLATDTAGKAVRPGLPTAAPTVESAGRTATPTVRRTVGQVTHAAAGVVGGTLRSAGTTGLPAGAGTLPVSALSGDTARLPGADLAPGLGGLPLAGLPLGG